MCIDNDNCIVSACGDLSGLFNFMLSHRLATPQVDDFVQLFEDHGCFRRDLRQLFDRLVQLRDSGAVSSIVMCTAAENMNGWPFFLRDVLHKWYGRPAYDAVVHRDMWVKYTLETCSASRCTHPDTKTLIKDMDLVRTMLSVGDSAPVYALDDHPEGVLNAHVVPVLPFYVTLDVDRLASKTVPGWGEDHVFRTKNMLESMRQSVVRRETEPWRFELPGVGDPDRPALMDALHRIWPE